MTLVLAWLRLELRRRWRSLAALALLVAISTAVVVTALAAARRGASALTRLSERTRPATLAVVANTPGFDWQPIRDLPEVEALTNFVVDYEMSIDGIDRSALSFPLIGTAYGRTIERPVMLSGRMFDPHSAHEAIVTRKFAAYYHKSVGDMLELHLPSAAALARSFVGADLRSYDGPAVPIRIVGVGISPWLSDSPDNPGGGIQLSPGVTAEYRANIVGPPGPDNQQFINALVRLRHGGADLAKFTEDLKRVTGRSDIGILSFVQEFADIQHQVAFESRCLAAFALAAFVAAIFLVGQAIARYAAGAAAEAQTQRALGMTPRQTTLVAAAGPAIVGALGAALGVVVSWVASAWFPYGTAALFEYDTGRQWDWLVTFSVGAGVIVLVAAGAAAAARLAVRAARRGTVARRSAVAATVRRSGASVPLIIGTRFALETGRGRQAVPVRPALIGAVTGVLGVVAAFTFAHGVSDAADHPERFGQTFALGAFLGVNSHDFAPTGPVTAALLAQPDVTGVVDSRTSVATAGNGRDAVALWEYDRLRKPGSVVVLDGRMPVKSDEVLLGPKTLAALHTAVGGTVRLRGTTPLRTMTVVGSGFVPVGPHNGYADGGWVSTAGYEALFGDGFKFHVGLIAIPSGTDPRAAAATLTRQLNRTVPQLRGQADIEPSEVPTEVSEIRQVRTLPIFLGAFLALLAVGAVGHALATAVRRRAHDLAVLRAVGMTPWQCRWAVITQATVLAFVGLIFGVPIGLALGRSIWRVVANYTPIQYVPPLAVSAMLLVIPAALLVANSLAAWPGRRAAKLRIATVLRAE